MVKFFTYSQVHVLNDLIIGKRIIRGLFCLLAVLLLFGQGLLAQIVITSSSNPSCKDDNLTFSATITPTTATGTIQFKDNGVDLGPPIIVGGSNVSIPALSPGTHTIIAIYSGDGANPPSTSNTIIQIVNEVPSITTPPLAQTVCTGFPATFSVTAQGGGLNYQWRKGGTPIAGANGSSYTINSVSSADIGNYDVVVTNNCGAITSDAATLALFQPLAPGSINTTGGSLCPNGNPATISNVIAASNGDGNYTYQWQFSTDCINWSDIASTNTLSYNPPPITQTTCYRRKVTDGCGTITFTEPTQFTVYPEPVSQTIAPTPAIVYSCSGTAPVVCTASVCAGTPISATFSGGSTGIPGRTDFTDVYEYSINGGAAWTPYSQGSSISTAGLSGSNIVRIRTRRVPSYTSLGCDFGEWNEVRWTVNALPAQFNVTGGGSYCAGGSGVTVGLSGSQSGVSYQLVNGTTNVGGPVAGTGSAISFGNQTASGTYAVVATDAVTGCVENMIGNVTVSITPTVTPSVFISANPGNNICAGTSVTFTATPTNGGPSPSYQWQINGVDVGTNSPTFTTSSLANTNQVRVILTSSAVCPLPASATSNTITMTVNDLVVPSVTIAPSATTICPGTPVSFTSIPINGGSNPSYQWMVNGGNAGTNSPNFSTSSLVNGDVVSLVLTSNAACASPSSVTSNTISITVNPGTPVAPGAITGTGTICPGIAGLTYSIASVPDATSYTWTVPGGWTITSGAGSTSITVTSGGAGQNGNITVTANNSCGTSTASTFPVTVSPGTPATPGTITGTSPVCPGIVNISYSIAAVSDANSYTWTVPVGWSITSGQGTNSITVSSGAAGQNGDITVTATNSCGTSNARILPVTVSPGTPAIPLSISGTSPVCPGITNLAYTIATVPNASSYNWTVPTGWNITSGQGTNSIIVTSGSAGQNGDITVTATNSCGISGASILPVAVNPGTPATPLTITGTTPVCPGITNLAYSIAAVPNASSYTWTVPAGWSITAGQGTAAITVTSGSAGQNGTISVTATNSCGTSSASNLAVIVSPGTPAVPGIITGATEQCISRTGLNYTISAVPNATSYTWLVPTGWNITSGQGTTGITVSTLGSASSGNITVTATNSCGTSSTSTLPVVVSGTVPTQPAQPSGPISICPVATGLVYTVPAVSNASSYIWTLPTGWSITSGAGTNTITVTVGSAAATGGQNISVRANNACGSSAASINLPVTVGTFASVNAGPDQVLCVSSPNFSYNASVGGAISGNNDVQWTTSGSGTFTNSGRRANGTYSPSAADVAAGTVTLTITTDDPAGTCSSVSDQVILTFKPNPTASISSVTPICSGATSIITFNGTPNTIVTYTVSGVGGSSTINIGASGTATLTTPALTANATYTLTSIGYAAAPACNQTITGSVTVTINAAATVNANNDQTVCASSPNVTLAGSVGGSATSGTWSGGAGTFAPNNTTLNATYTPTAAEIAAGNVTLILTTNDPAGPCGPVSDQMVITINQSVLTNAGVDQTVCASGAAVTLAGSVTGAATTGTWSGGGGSFTPNNTTLNAVYTPTATEIASGSVTLTLTSADPAGPCGSSSDQVIIFINPSVVTNAGIDQTVCASSAAVTLVGSVTGTVTTGTWSGGAGTFAPNNTTLNAVYTPTAAEIAAGSVTLTLTSDDPAGPCGPTSDQVVITINPLVVTNAGTDQAICATGAAVTLAGSVTGSATTGTWSGGGGTFVPNNTTLNATYTPSSAEIASGNVTLTLTSADPAGPCGSTSDQVIITINPSATVSAGVPLTICSNGTATMAGSFGGGATSATWSSSGSGTFNNNSPTAIYTPSVADINAGTVTLTYTTNDPVGPCSAASTSITLTIRKQVVITTQPSNTSVCATFPTDLSVVAIGDGLNYQWYKGTAPAGTPISNSANITGAQSANLHFNQASLADDGSYYVVVSGAAPCAPITSAQRTLNVDQAITISTQPLTQTLCTGANVTFAVVADANGDLLSYQWRKNGVNISGQTSSSLTINNITSGDAGNYDVVISGPPGFTCSSVISSPAALTVTPSVAAPVFGAGSTSTRCQGTGSVTYTATAANSTGITYSLDAVTVAAGNAINPSTGMVTYVAGWSGTSTITVTAAGCNGPTTATHTVSITPSVLVPVFGSGTSSTRCQGAGSVTYSATAANSTGITYALDAASVAAGNTINPSTGIVIYDIGWSGISTITATAAGCNGPTSSTHTVNITPSVSTPVFGSGTSSTRCQGIGSVTYTANAANSTGITYTLDAASIAAGNSINSANGAVTYVSGWSGTTTITATASGCNGPKITTHTVTVTPTVTINPFSSASSTRCQGAGSTTYTTTAINSTGITYSLDATSLAAGNTINPTTGVVIFVAGWSGTTSITASAAGCNGPVTTIHTVSVSPTSNGGTISPSTPTVACANANNGTLTLSGNTGAITRWESSTNGGVTWAPIANTSNLLTYTNLAQTTLYRAVIQSGTCPAAYSTYAVVSIIPPQTPIASANPSTICVGQSSVLTSNSGLPSGTSGVDGSFSGANPPGWCVDGQCTGSFLSANGDNQQTGPWRETNPHDFVGINYTSPDPKFAIANGINTSTLETPVFSLIGQSPASLDFFQSYILNAGSSAKIEISTDGGVTYTNILAQYTGVSSLGISGVNSTMQSTSISLANYIGLSNLKIKFTYRGLDNNSAWVLDGIAFPGSISPVNYTWSASDGSTITGQSSTVSPTTTTTYTLTAVMNGCILGSTNVTVTVFQLPIVTTTNSCVGGGTVTFTQTGGVPGGTWSVTGGGTIDPNTGVFNPNAAGCFTATYRTPGPGCTDTKSFVVFPAVPTLAVPANTCASAFTLPTVPAVSGFNVQYSIDGGGFSASPTIPTTPGCHAIAARYVLTAACGGTAAGTPATCGPSNTVNVVIFPSAPVITAPGNTCASAFTLPAVPAVSGFNIEYSIDGGVFSASPSTTTPGCHTITARYVLAAACGSTAAGTAGAACASSNTVNVVIFPSVPVLTAPVNTCASSFTLPGVPAVSGFNIEYSIDGGAFSTSPSTVTPGCHTVAARYVLAATCGSTPAGTQGTGACGTSNTVNVVIFPAAPVITAPANTCASAFALPGVASVSGFNIEYSIDGGAFSASPSTTTPGCHTVTARYVLAAACGGTAAGTAGTGACSQSNTVSTVIFPAAPTAPIVSTGCGPIVVTAPVSISGFNIEYSFDDGATWGANNPPTADNCAGYKIKTRYVLAAACGSIPAGTAGTIAGCTESPATTKIVDNTAPTITCPPAQIFCIVADNTYTIPLLIGSDNCSSTLNIAYQITGATVRSGSGNASGLFNTGVSIITWTVTDTCGNTSTCSTQVTVNPKPNPIIYHN